MGLEKYLRHDRSCNREQNWDEATEALSYTPAGTPGLHEAWEELNEKRAKCTCGFNDTIYNYTLAWYKKGWQDSGEPGEEELIDNTFTRLYGDQMIKL